MKKIKIKTGDNVKVITGNNKGSEGKVLKIVSDKSRLIVEGVNMVKKHMKPNAQNPQGGIIEKEASIHRLVNQQKLDIEWMIIRKWDFQKNLMK